MWSTLTFLWCSYYELLNTKYSNMKLVLIIYYLKTMWGNISCHVPNTQAFVMWILESQICNVKDRIKLTYKKNFCFFPNVNLETTVVAKLYKSDWIPRFCSFKFHIIKSNCNQGLNYPSIKRVKNTKGFIEVIVNFRILCKIFTRQFFVQRTNNILNNPHPYIWNYFFQMIYKSSAMLHLPSARMSNYIS